MSVQNRIDMNDIEEVLAGKDAAAETVCIKESAQNTSEFTSLFCMNMVVKVLDKEKSITEVQKILDREISYLGQMFSISPIQSVLMSVIAEEAGFSGRTTTKELVKRLNITNIEMSMLRTDIENLSRQHIVRIIAKDGFGGFYQIYEDAAEAMVNNVQFKVPEFINVSTEEIFTRMRYLFSEFFSDSLSFDRLSEELESLVNNNPHSTFCSKVKEHGLMSNYCFSIFMYMCHRCVSHGDNHVRIGKILELLSDDCDDKMIERRIMNEDTPLQKSHLVEFCSDDGLVDSSRICLNTDTIKEFLSELNIQIHDSTAPCPEMTDHNLIVEKILFFNAQENEQVERLSEVLSEENFMKIQTRLKEQGIRTGINILLYGPPGTGKTELCFQLARITGRDIFTVDVSQLKSKWVGDSEKAIRSLFCSYRNTVQHSERCPILLFNEADAIFGTRMKDAEMSVDKLNNTLQNIILMEMEAIDGIMIATTNLENNLDQAFDRRFLFKLELKHPEEKVREKIWKHMLPHLSDEECDMLAETYDFSGGQIENINRKALIKYIINGNHAGFGELCKYCDEETLKHSHYKKVGFNL